MSTTAALVEGHYIATESTRRPNGVIVHQAGCQCGAQFEWNDRDKAHALHLLDVVRAEERERIARNIEADRGEVPWSEDSHVDGIRNCLSEDGNGGLYPSSAISLPARVLYDPEEDR